MQLRAVVIDSDPTFRFLASDVLRGDGWHVTEADIAEEALQLFERERYQLVLYSPDEHNGSGGDDLTVLLDIKRVAGMNTHIIVTATHQTTHTAVAVILNGASDFIAKPCTVSEIRERSRALIARLHAIEREANHDFCEHETIKAAGIHSSGELIGRSSATINVLKEIARSVQSDQKAFEVSKQKYPPTYFITGDTGTGKELAAQLIHKHSRYRDGHFVPINCSNLTPELADAELFGSCPGAYTGAPREDRAGLWEMASGGTLFLDEITEAPTTVLPKLLRVLQDGNVKRLGARHWTKVNVQVIAASNRDVLAEIRAGRFREDLYHRLSLHHLHLPPLRERIEDVPLIIEHFLRLHFDCPVRFASDAIEMLMSYSFPGNVRELENIVRGATRKSPDGTVYGVDLRSYLKRAEASDKHTCADERPKKSTAKREQIFAQQSQSEESLDDRVRRYMLHVIHDALTECDGNKTRAAQRLKISRPRLYKLLDEQERAAS